MRLGATEVWLSIEASEDFSVVRLFHLETSRNEDFDRLMRTFAQKFGRPTGVTITPMQNGFGARYVRKVYWWFARKQEVVCDLDPNNSGLGSCELRPRERKPEPPPGPI